MRGGSNRLLLAGWLATIGCSHSPQAPARRPVETVAEVARACAAPGAAPTCPALAVELELLLARELSATAFTELLTQVRAGQSGGLPAEVTRAVRAVAGEPPVAGRLDALAEFNAQLVQYAQATPEWRSSIEGQTTFAELTVRRSLVLAGIAPAARNRLNDLAAALRAGTEPDPPAVYSGESGPMLEVARPQARRPPSPPAVAGATP
jgi:hypothetical protein